MSCGLGVLGDVMEEVRRVFQNTEGAEFKGGSGAGS